MSVNPPSEVRSADLPAEMRALVLDGTGFDHLRVRKVPTPRPGPGQMLARVDAAGICTSLIKLVEQGPDHKFVYGWDITRFPLILGDEGSVTLLEVGETLRDRYRPGQRFVVQPAVDHPPINNRERYRDQGQGIDKVAVGYTLPGHLAEYILITEEVLAAGCLLPLPDSGIPHAHAALSEPFSCAVSAQEHHTHLVQRDPLSRERSRKWPQAGRRYGDRGGRRHGPHARRSRAERQAACDRRCGPDGRTAGTGPHSVRSARRCRGIDLQNRESGVGRPCSLPSGASPDGRGSRRRDRRGGQPGSYRNGTGPRCPGRCTEPVRRAQEGRGSGRI